MTTAKTRHRTITGYKTLAKEVKARYRELRIVCHEQKAENIIKQEFSISENELDSLLEYKGAA